MGLRSGERKDEKDGKDEKDAAAELLAKSGVDLQMNSTEKLDALDLDTPVIGALSATIWGEALLASDTEGRIWFYTSQTSQTLQTSQTFALQHKVWGGSYAGFAQGLRLAAVDWENDGDLDCLCGTAEGKLMLLRDPKVGRPTNLKALVGVDNVKLDWDPNQQSRIRGYKVYRADEVKVEGEGEQWNLLAFSSLPTYRDYPPSVAISITKCRPSRGIMWRAIRRRLKANLRQPRLSVLRLAR